MARIYGNFQGAFCKICRKVETKGQSSQGSGGVWATKPFQNWKKAVQKMKEHASSESHLRQVEAELIVSRGETVVHQLQRFGDSERTRTGKPSKKNGNQTIPSIPQVCDDPLPFHRMYIYSIQIVISRIKL